MSEGFKATLKAVMDSLPPDMPLLLLGSTECEPGDMYCMYMYVLVTVT